MRKLANHIWASLRQWRLVGIVYLLQLLIGLFVGGKLFLLIDDKLGHTGAMSAFRDGWNYSAVHDFLFYYGRELSSIQSQFGVLLLIYLVLSAFISAGLWYSLSSTDQRVSFFWSGVKSYWGRFLGLGLISVLLTLLMSIIIWAPFASNVMIWLEHKPDERFVVYVGLGLLILWIVLLSLLFCWSYFVRSHYVMEQQTFFSGMKRGIQSLRRDLGRILLVVLFYTLVSLLLIYLSISLEAWIGITSASLIIIAIVIQQIVVWTKISLRISLISYFLCIHK